MTKPTKTNPPEVSAMLKRIEAHGKKYRTTLAKLEELQAGRRALYLEARALTPPIPYRTIGVAAGVTEAAVIQVVNKAEAARDADA